MAKLQTQIIYNHQIGLQGIPETHLSIFEHSPNQMLSRTPRNQISWLEKVAIGRLMIKSIKYRTPRPQDEELKLLDQLGKSGILRKVIKTAKAPTNITKVTPLKQNLLTINQNPQDWIKEYQYTILSPQNQYML